MARLHWTPDKEKALTEDLLNGLSRTHCGSRVLGENLTEDADEVNASPRGCPKCRITKGYPDLPDYPRWQKRVMNFAKDIMSLLDSLPPDATVIEAEILRAMREKHSL